MFNTSPAMKEAISRTCGDPATKIVSVLPDLDRERVKNYLEKLVDFLRGSYYEDLKEVEYLLRIDSSLLNSDSRTKLNPNFISQTLRSSANTFLVDCDFNILAIDSCDTSASAISQYSLQEKCCVIHILNGLDFVIYANGITIKEMNILSPIRGPVSRKKYARSADDYVLSIIEHYKNRVRFSQFCDHWGDRNKRLLRAGQTEMIFHSNLQNWLQENLEYATVYGRARKVTGNETDIEIRTLESRGKFYIIEVKWLGENERNTRFTQKDLAKAIKQVKNYLKSESGVLEACLVAYDGRDLEDFRKLEAYDGENDQWKEIRKCQNEELPNRGKGLVFFLESKSASQTE